MPPFNQIYTTWQKSVYKVRVKVININIKFNIFIIILLQYLMKTFHKIILL